MESLLRKMSGVPWGFVLLFDAAALLALTMAFALVTSATKTQSQVAAKGDKRIALTFDDSPRGPGAFLEPDARAQMLLAGLKRAGVRQAAFFANPGRTSAGGLTEAQLLAYAKAGHVLANHTAKHKVLSDVSAESFIADIAEAEKWLKAHPGYRPWFRFPQLDEGNRNNAKRDAVRAALKSMGLRHGYVTADGWDWYLENLTIKAKSAGKPMDMDALRDLYVETHVQSADFADSLARRTLGRAPAQVLLLHETDLAALYLEDMVNALRKDGWTIITADQAYADPMGKLPLPVKANANGTLIQMLSWERGTKGPRWFARNEPDEMTRLFNERVLQAK